MKKRFLTLLLLTLAGIAPLFSQTYGTGAILDDTLYNSLPQKARLATRAYESLPQAVSLKQYAPYPGNQNPYGTCTAWSSAYAARTITESIAINRRDRFLTTNSVFSPAFIYKNISNDPTCQSGTVISDALNLMKKQGAVKMQEREKTADFKNIVLSWFTDSRKYPIADYATLYSSGRTEAGNASFRIQAVKKSLSENKPVVFGMNCPSSFFTAKGVWRPAESPAINYGGHAMVVVGYDDAKYGGAFEVQNSWGVQWGNDGYMWIPYDVFAQFANQSYEMIEDLTNYKTAAEYSGFVTIEVRGSRAGMPVTFADGCYKTQSPQPSGTRFRYLMGNGSPAYVYAFASDNTAAPVVKIFPLGNTSPALDYAENIIAFPLEDGGGQKWIQMDAVSGTDYLVVLYAKQPLDIDAIMARYEKERSAQPPAMPPATPASNSGAFPAWVARAVGPNLIPYKSVQYEKNEMRFNAKSTNSKAVFALLLAIGHT